MTGQDTVLAGRYRLQEQIASGGMGVVWRARDEVLQRDVAVKLLHETLSDDTLAAERFRREALTAAGLTHPNMASVYDYVEDGGSPGIVMELVDGETLAQRLGREGALPVNEAVRIAVAMLDALAAAHAEGVVHRDIKPANILLTPEGRVKVTDFGIARSLAVSQLTATGTVLGTAHYSAPEQVRGQSSSPATDVYSVGVVLYEMLTGSRPFEADNAVAVAMKRLQEDPPAPGSLRAGIPLVVEQVVMRALARAPSDRFPSASAMRDALRPPADATPGPPTQVLSGAPGDPTIAMAGVTPVVLPPSAAPRREAAPSRASAATAAARARPAARWLAAVAAVVVLLVLGVLLIGGKRPIAPARAHSSSSPRASAAACCLVPNVIGDTLDQARAEILNVSGFDHYRYEIVAHPGATPGTVFDQSPPAGQMLARTDSQGPTIYVAQDQPPSTSPPPHGKPKDHGKGNGNGD